MLAEDAKDAPLKGSKDVAPKGSKESTGIGVDQSPNHACSIPPQWGRLSPIRDRPETPEGQFSRGRRFSKSCRYVTDGQAATSILDVQKIYARCELFDKCSSDFVRSLVLEGGESAVQGCIYDPQTDVVKQGSSGHSMFLLHRGQVEVLVSRTPVRVLGPDSIFGEMNLLGLTAVRSATVRTITICHLFEVRSDIFVKLLLRFHAERRLFEKVAMARYREIQDHQQSQRKRLFQFQQGRMETVSATLTPKSRPSEELSKAKPSGNGLEKKQKKKQQMDSPRAPREGEGPSTPQKDKNGRRKTNLTGAPQIFLQAAEEKEEEDEAESTPTHKERAEDAYVKSKTYTFTQEAPNPFEFGQGSHLTGRGPRGSKGKKAEKEIEEAKEFDKQMAYGGFLQALSATRGSVAAQKEQSDKKGSNPRSAKDKENKYAVEEKVADSLVQRVARSLRGDTRRGFMMPATRAGEEAGEDAEGVEPELAEGDFLDPQLLPPVGVLSPSQKHGLLRQLRQQAHLKMKRGMGKIKVGLMLNASVSKTAKAVKEQ